MRRRELLGLVAAVGGIAASTRAAWPQASARRGTPLIPRTDRELRGVLGDASNLKLGGPVVAGATDPLALADIVDRALAEGVGNDDAANLALRAGMLLSELTRDQRDGLEILPTDPVPAAPRYRYNETLKKEYSDLFRSATIAPSSAAELARVARFVTSARPKARYKQVEADTGVPWYVIGALHYREANLNFMGHLHCGDPLLLQTVHVPAKRPPKPWTPPNVTDPEQLWRLSAQDALRQLSARVPNWSLQRMCYEFESYNGFGCRDHHINSPYLWNYTNHYRGGGFPRDHFFDPNYRSRQAGVVAIIVELKKVDPDGVQLTFEA